MLASTSRKTPEGLDIPVFWTSEEIAGMLSKCGFIDNNFVDFIIKGWKRKPKYNVIFAGGEIVVWTTEVSLLTEYNIDQEKSPYICDANKIEALKNLTNNQDILNAKLVRICYLLKTIAKIY